MAKIVIDSSVVIKWFDPEPYTAESDRILAAYATGALALLAPDILPAEVGNIIWKKQILLKRSTAREAQGILQKFQDLRSRSRQQLVFWMTLMILLLHIDVQYMMRSTWRSAFENNVPL